MSQPIVDFPDPLFALLATACLLDHFLPSSKHFSNPFTKIVFTLTFFFDWHIDYL